MLRNCKVELYKLYESNKGCCQLGFALGSVGGPLFCETDKDATSMAASGLEAREQSHGDSHGGSEDSVAIS